MAMIKHSFRAAPGLSDRLTEEGWDVTTLGTGIEATTGSSLLMRLGGAFLTPADKMPVDLRAAPSVDGDGFDVVLEHRVSDPLAKRRYEKLFDALEQDLAA